MNIQSYVDAIKYLGQIPKLSGDTCDIYNAALAFSCLQDGDFDIVPYLDHLDDMSATLKDIHTKCLDKGDADTVDVRHESLARVIYDKFEYRGDDENYDDLKNASLKSVIDRRRGLPVALGIIYMQVARNQGWDVSGISFPGHFILRLSMGSDQILIDPFREGAVLNAGDLRQILKVLMGQSAELSHSYYEDVRDCDVLVRLQNNLKTRLIDAEDYAKALDVVEHTRLIVPTEYRLLFDAAMLKVKTDQIKSAHDDISSYIELAPTAAERAEAEQLLYEIQRQMN